LVKGECGAAALEGSEQYSWVGKKDIIKSAKGP